MITAQVRMQVLAITFIHHIKNMAVVLLPHSTYVVTTLSITYDIR